MFGFIKKTLSLIYEAFSSQLKQLFSRPTVDEETLTQLERILIEADTGVTLTRKLIAELTSDVKKGRIAKGADLQAALQEKLLAIVSQKSYERNAQVFLLVGVNGSGKTTAVGKLAYQFAQQNVPVTIAAADTFRAAAVDQVAVWAERAGATCITGKEGQDPASVVFAACESYKKTGAGVLIIDTAGRLQTKVNLMRELEKIGKIVAKQLPDKKISTLLTVDAMLGQNSFDQAQLFHESTKLDGIILTKCDGTGKGGIVFSITERLGVPVAFISFGEKIDEIKPFDAREYVTDLVNS